LQAKAGMALASWRPPAGHLPQPPDVSRPCQKQLSPRSHLLQVVSEALDIPIHQQQQQQELLGGVPLQTPEVVIAEKSAAAKKFDFPANLRHHRLLVVKQMWLLPLMDKSRMDLFYMGITFHMFLKRPLTPQVPEKNLPKFYQSVQFAAKNLFV